MNQAYIPPDDCIDMDKNELVQGFAILITRDNPLEVQGIRNWLRKGADYIFCTENCQPIDHIHVLANKSC